jgi:hypothetical protein
MLVATAKRRLLPWCIQISEGARFGDYDFFFVSRALTAANSCPG